MVLEPWFCIVLRLKYGYELFTIKEFDFPTLWERHLNAELFIILFSFI